jgi:hypothetical protein
MAVRPRPGTYEHLLPPEERALSKSRRAARHTPGQMNKTEAAYAKRLEGLRLVGRIVAWEFEPEALVLSKSRRCTYRPDFRVWTADGHEWHEVKGSFIREDSAIKLKRAAEKFGQIPFFLCVYKKGKWTIKRV